MSTAVAVSALIQMLTDPRITKIFIHQSLVVFTVYVVHVGIGILVVVYLLPWGPAAALGVTATVLGWIGLGGLGLIRFAPRLREPHALLLYFGLADAVCLLFIIVGICSAYGVF